MNRQLLDVFISVYWPLLAFCAFLGLMPIGAENLIPPVVWGLMFGIAGVARSLDRRSRVLMMTPVSQRKYATFYWVLTVLSVPVLHTIQKAFPGGMSGDWLLRRAILLAGVAASACLFAKVNSWAPSPWLKFVIRPLLALAVLGCVFLFGWLMTWEESGGNPIMTMGLLSAAAITVWSFIARQATWSPASRLAMRKNAKPTPSNEPDTVPTRFWPLHFLWMWRVHLLLGVNLGLLFLVMNEVAHLLLNVRVEVIWVFALLLTGCGDVTRALDVHTVRSMPISRQGQTALYLAYPATAFLPALLMVPIGSVWYGWDPLRALGIVLAAMSVHCLCTAAQIVTEETFFVMLEGMLFLGAVLLFIAIPWPVAFYYVVVATFGLAALSVVYNLLGSSSAYHRGRWDAESMERVR